MNAISFFQGFWERPHLLFSTVMRGEQTAWGRVGDNSTDNLSREATILSKRTTADQAMPVDSHRNVGRLRERLVRRELEKSSILASIASPYTSVVQIRGAVSRYTDLEAEIQNIIDQIQTATCSELTTPPHRRLNKDGTIDSICVRCFTTIASCRREEDLKAAEIAHVCDSEALRRFDH